MTNSQKKMVEELKRKAAEELFWGGADGYEFKECSTREYFPGKSYGFVSLTIETGLIGDEGTAAELHARDRFQCFIGTRGGVTYPVQTANGKDVYRRFKGRVLPMVLDQCSEF